METTPAPFLRERLIRLFQTLDTPRDKRNPYLEPELCAFPNTNGGLFKTGTTGVSPVGNVNGQDARSPSIDDIPPLTDDIRQLLIGSSQFDWHDITPTVFGALFESTLNPETRRAGGMSYTSVENIHKVIDPLFLPALEKHFEEICNCESAKMCKCENMEMTKGESFSHLHNSTFHNPIISHCRRDSGENSSPCRTKSPRSPSSIPPSVPATSSRKPTSASAVWKTASSPRCSKGRPSLTSAFQSRCRSRSSTAWR